MDASTISIEDVKRAGREAAERGADPTECPYMRGTDAEYHWKDAFYIRVYQLSGEESA